MPTISKYKTEYSLVYHSITKITKDLRKKYNLSVLGFSLLNSIYVYCTISKKDYFTINNIYEFIEYLNRNKLNYYIKLFIESGYLVEHHKSGKRVYYSLTSNMTNVIKSFSHLYSYYLLSLSDKGYKIPKY